MHLLLPVLVPIAGGILVFRLKSEQARNRAVFWTAAVTSVLALSACVCGTTAWPGSLWRWCV